jgi:hypothetical protein
MKRCSIWWPFVFAMVLGVTGCGDEGDPGGGGAGGSGATGGSGAGGSGATGGDGTGGSGATSGGDCARICRSPCLEDFPPPGTVDDCERSCATGFFTCIPELVAVYDCFEAYSCDPGVSCLDETRDFTSCTIP